MLSAIRPHATHTLPDCDIAPQALTLLALIESGLRCDVGGAWRQNTPSTGAITMMPIVMP